MRKKEEQPKIRFIFEPTHEAEAWPIEDLDLDFYKTLQRAGITTLGGVLDHWDILEHIKGMGEDKVKVTKANTFAALCAFGCVKKLQLKEN